MAKGLSDLQAVLKNSNVEAVAATSVVKLSSKEDRFEALKAVEKTLNKQFNTTTSIVRLGAKVGVLMPSISTELPSLDYEVIGTGGIPIGRIIEFFGPESSGKTTLALHIAAMEQKNTDNIVAFIDAEHSLDPTYAAKLGVNVDELLISQPDSGEQALETVEALINSKAVSLIIVDSVAALVPQAELDGDMGDANVGLQARLMSQAMRKLRGKAATNSVTVIFINQIREKIGVMFGSPETTTGGRALKFFSSIRLDIRRREAIKDGDSIIGHKLHIKAVKNKVGVPLRETDIQLIYENGIDTFTNFIEYAIRINVIQQSGSWFSFNKENLGHGLTNVIACFKNDDKLFEQMKAEIAKAQAVQREVENQ